MANETGRRKEHLIQLLYVEQKRYLLKPQLSLKKIIHFKSQTSLRNLHLRLQNKLKIIPSEIFYKNQIKFLKTIFSHFWHAI